MGVIPKVVGVPQWEFSLSGQKMEMAARREIAAGGDENEMRAERYRTAFFSTMR